MGHNVDLSFFGISDLKCSNCKEIIDISEVDIDCDLTTSEKNTFDLNIQCQKCHEDTTFKFKLVIV